RLILVFAMTAAAQNAIRAGESLVYFGTYTGPNSKGIYVSRMNLEEGTLTPPRLAAEAQNPSFLAVSPSGQHLYAVGELNEVAGRPGGIVTAFRIEPDTGALSRLNEQAARGAAPCHLTVDASGKWVLVANYSGGNLAVLPIREDGSLGEVVSFIQHEGSGVNPRRQRQAHAHSINLDAANRFAVAA